jgi:hypothetical protein
MWSSRAALLAPLVVLALTTCCAGSGDEPAGGSGIEGLVTIGPQCPVVQEPTPCPDLLFAATIVVQDVATGERVAEGESGEDGRFRIDLPPGSYRVLPQWPNDPGPPTAQEQLAEVEEGRYTRVDVQYDTGIR